MTTAQRTAKSGKTRKPPVNKPDEKTSGPAPKTLKDHSFYGLRLDPEQEKFRDALWDEKKRIVFVNAKAGTGKTTISVAVANLLVEHGLYDGLTHIVFPCEEKSLGFLPGDISQKTALYSMPLYQALIECGIQPEKAVVTNGAASIKDGAWVEFMPATFLRGYNFKNRVIVLDEAQNAHSLKELGKVLTRCADNCKVIVIGHSGQADVYHSGLSPFEQYINHFEGDPRTAVCHLTTNYRGWISSHADELLG